MRWTTTSMFLMAILMATPAMGQEAHEGREGHGDMPAGHDGMKMRHGGEGMLAGHAEHLGLTAQQTAAFEALDERLAAEKERHHAEMKAIHEAAMEILTPEQRERMHAMMEEKHGKKHGE